MKNEQDNAALTMLRRIDSKLDSLLKRLASYVDRIPTSDRTTSKELFLRAREIAEMTPKSVQQTDAAELLRQDRTR